MYVVYANFLNKQIMGKKFWIVTKSPKMAFMGTQRAIIDPYEAPFGPSAPLRGPNELLEGHNLPWRGFNMAC